MPRYEPGDLVSPKEIAERLTKLSGQPVDVSLVVRWESRYWSKPAARGVRLPKLLTTLSGVRIYSWSDVEVWARAQGYPKFRRSVGSGASGADGTNRATTRDAAAEG